MQPNFLNAPASAWPTDMDELLLKAALWQGEDAARAYAQWEARVDIEAIGYGAFRLLPLLYHNLKQQSVASRHEKRLAGVARRAWAENQVILHRAANAVRGLAAAGIPVMLLKGVPLIIQVYRNPGLRTLGDVDLLVRPADAPAALDWLAANGWHYKLGDLPLDPLRTTSGLNFLSPEGLDLDLHWALLFNRPEPENDQLFWEAATPLTLNGETALGPCWTDLFLTACLQGFRWDPVLPLRWVADTYWMLGAPDREIDWERLVWRAQRLEQALVLRAALSYLNQSFELPINASALRALWRTPVGGYERLEGFVFLRRPLPLVGLSLVKYLTERRLPVYGGRGLLAYLKTLWATRSVWGLLPEAVRRSIRLLRRVRLP